MGGLRMHSFSPRTLKQREQNPLIETEDEIENMDDSDWGPGDF